MPPYREVAEQPLRQLIRHPEDDVHTVRANETLLDANAKIASSPIFALAVVDDNGNAVGVIEEPYIPQALRTGAELTSQCVVAMRTDQIVRETMTLEGLRSFVGPFRTILVIDESGKPVAHIHRAALAERIRNLA